MTAQESALQKGGISIHHGDAKALAIGKMTAACSLTMQAFSDQSEADDEHVHGAWIIGSDALEVERMPLQERARADVV